MLLDQIVLWAELFASQLVLIQIVSHQISFVYAKAQSFYVALTVLPSADGDEVLNLQ